MKCDASASTARATVTPTETVIVAAAVRLAPLLAARGEKKARTKGKHSGTIAENVWLEGE